MSSTSVADKVRELLVSQKPEFGDIFTRTYSSKAATPEKEIADLNKYFRIALSNADVSTMDERGRLRDELAPGVWLKYFESHVLPTLVRFNLLSE